MSPRQPCTPGRAHAAALPRPPPGARARPRGTWVQLALQAGQTRRARQSCGLGGLRRRRLPARLRAPPSRRGCPSTAGAPGTRRQAPGCTRAPGRGPLAAGSPPLWPPPRVTQAHTGPRPPPRRTRPTAWAPRPRGEPGPPCASSQPGPAGGCRAPGQTMGMTSGRGPGPGGSCARLQAPVRVAWAGPRCLSTSRPPHLAGRGTQIRQTLSLCPGLPSPRLWGPQGPRQRTVALS